MRLLSESLDASAKKTLAKRSRACLANRSGGAYRSMMSRSRNAVLATGALTLLAAVGILDVVVLLPRMLAPSTPVPDVWEDVVAAGDLLPVLAGPVVWALICMAFATWSLASRRTVMTTRTRAMALIAFGVLAVLEQVAAFGMNLWLSNHLPPFEGGTTTLGFCLLLLGALAAVAGVLMIAAAARRRRPRTAASE